MRSVIRRAVTTMISAFLFQPPLSSISPKHHQYSLLLPLTTQRFLTASHSFRLRTFSTKSIPNMQDSASVSYLSQREAAEIDETLMGPLGFSVDQLMVSPPLPSSPSSALVSPAWSWLVFLSFLQELAGLSVATSVAEVNWIPIFVLFSFKKVNS